MTTICAALGLAWRTASYVLLARTCQRRRAPENRRRRVGRARTGGTLLSETAGGQEPGYLRRRSQPNPARTAALGVSRTSGPCSGRVMKTTAESGDEAP